MITGLPPFYSQDVQVLTVLCMWIRVMSPTNQFFVQEMYRKIVSEPLKFPDYMSAPAKVRAECRVSHTQHDRPLRAVYQLLIVMCGIL